MHIVRFNLEYKIDDDKYYRKHIYNSFQVHPCL
jgi:hypothetical protein